MSWNEIGIIVAAVGVVIGVILEGWEHWQDFRNKGWKPIVPKVGFAILVVSLAVEIVFDARLAQESANTELAAETVKNKSIQVRATMEELGWRLLDDGKLKAELKGKPKGSVRFLYDSCSVESWMFAMQMWRGLLNAGWKASDPEPIPSNGNLLETFHRIGLNLAKPEISARYVLRNCLKPC
jgi:hypothetical protein